MPLPGLSGGPPVALCPACVPLLSEDAWKVVGRSLRLSKRQLQIVRAVINDDTEYKIGANLGISPHTVHTHLERIHRKLGVHDRVALVVRIFAEFLRRTADPASGLPSVCANRANGKCPLQAFPAP